MRLCARPFPGWRLLQSGGKAVCPPWPSAQRLNRVRQGHGQVCLPAAVGKSRVLHAAWLCLDCTQDLTKKQDAAFSAYLMQQTQLHRQEVTSLQQRLTQHGFELINKQHELGRMKQQLHDATGRAERAHAAAVALRCGGTTHR